MKKTTIIGSIATAAVTTVLTMAGATAANTDGCNPSPGTGPKTGAWAAVDHTGWTPDPSVPADPDGQSGEDNLLNIKQIGERERTDVSNGDGRTETIPGTPGFWSSFEPTDKHAPFDGPPEYPSDPRGKWSAPKTEGGPNQDASGVYQDGNGNGSWFYRDQGTPKRVIEHSATTTTKYRWVIEERVNTEGTDPVTCEEPGDGGEEQPPIEKEQPPTTGEEQRPMTDEQQPETPVTRETPDTPDTIKPVARTPDTVLAVASTTAVRYHTAPVHHRSAVVPTSIDAGL